MIVGIDPGHGGVNRGCWVREFGDEADYVLKLGRRLREVIPGSVLLRQYDQTMDLYQRNEIATSNECDIVVSLHANAVEGDVLHGLSCFSFPGNERTLALGKRINILCPPELVAKPRDGVLRAKPMVIADKTPWKARARSVLRHFGCDVLLIEVGFGAVDFAAMLDLGVQYRLCLAINKAIGEIYGQQD